MKTKNLISAMFISLLGIYMQSALASTYFLDQSNTLADGTKYAQVDVVEHNGNLDFTVNALTPTNWKFSDFYFNLGGNVGTVSLTQVPGWNISTKPKIISEFGLFSNGEKGNGDSLLSSFNFTVDSTVNLTLANLVANNDGWIFAAHSQCQKDCSGIMINNKLVTSHQIAGPDEYTAKVSPVPLPGAVWLFGSALFGFISLSNRRKI
jgi:hypothetical protein